MDTTLNLGGGLLYKYIIQYVANNLWRAYFCSGSGCTVLVNANLLTNQRDYVIDGGESYGGGSNTVGVKWGDITNRENQYARYGASGRYSWCWNSYYIGVPSGGSVSDCNTSTYGWTSSYK